MTALIAIGVLCVLLVLVYNGLVSKRVTCDNAWSQISVQLKRRHDLIPNLVECVKGYASHEKDTLERVIQARNTAVTTSQQGGVNTQSQAESALSGALRQVFALSESYPDLKANQNFLSLQEEISSTENRISFSRQYYNDCVGIYNTALEQIPGSLIKNLGAFPPKEFFQLNETESKAVQEAPKVSF